MNNPSRNGTLLEEKLESRLTERLCQSVVIMMGTFVFLNPFLRMTALKEITFYGSLAIALYLLTSRKKTAFWSFPLTIPFLLLSAWSAIGILFAVDRANSLHDVIYHLFKHLALFFLLLFFYPNRRHYQILVWIVILSATVFSIAAMVDFYVIQGHGIEARLDDRLTYRGGYRFLEMSANYMGFITIFATLLSMNQFFKERLPTRKALLILCFLATVTAVLLTQTRGAIFALVLAVILLGMKASWGRLIALLVAVTVATVILTSDTSRERFSINKMKSDERVGITLMYWEMIKERPLKGIGFGMELLQEKEFMKQYYDRVPVAYRDPAFNMSPHNFYVDVTVRLGVVGLLLYLGIVITALHMVWQIFCNSADLIDRRDALFLGVSFLAFLVQSLFADSSFGPPAIVFYLHLAMITILWKESCRRLQI